MNLRKPSTLGPSSVVVQRPEQVGATIDEVTAIMSVDQAVYFLLDETGSAIWARLATPTRVSDLCASLVAEFEVEPEACSRDVLGFLQDLLARDLVQIVA